MSEELIVRHCSPTLAGIKTGSLFSCPYTSERVLREDIRRWNRQLAVKGLRILPLRISEKTALIYVYRPARLKRDLANSEAASLLEERGYGDARPEHCVVKLIRRLQASSEFPHEIGLFLGYPPEDVQGFIRNGARDCKCTGCWKVYGDEEKAQKLFAWYKKCTDEYIRQLTHGKTLERLTVAV